MKQIVLFFALFSVSYNLLAQTLDQKIEELERQIRLLEDSLLNAKINSIKEKIKLQISRDTSRLSEYEKSLRYDLKNKPEKVWGFLEKADSANKYFKLIPEIQSQPISGKRGQYYYFEATNPNTQASLLFKTGKYTIIDNGNANMLSASLVQILNTIRAANKRNQDKKYEIFILGSADALGGNSPVGDQSLESVQFYAPLAVLRWNNGVYQSPAVPIPPIPQNFSNDDLPNLRSAYIQKVLVENKLYTILPQIVHLLEGKVTNRVNPLDRNVRVMVYFEDK